MSQQQSGSWRGQLGQADEGVVDRCGPGSVLRPVTLAGFSKSSSDGSDAKCSPQEAGPYSGGLKDSRWPRGVPGTIDELGALLKAQFGGLGVCPDSMLASPTHGELILRLSR